MKKTFYRAAGEPGQFYHSVGTARRLLQARANKQGRSFDLQKWRVNRNAQYELVDTVAHIEPKRSNVARKNAGPNSVRKSKKAAKRWPGRTAGRAVKNPGGATIRGWLKAKAVKIVRDSKGRAVKVQIKT